MIKTNKITHLLPVFCIINLNIVSWTFLCYFPSHSEEFDSFEKVDFNINLHGDLWKFRIFFEILKCFENFEILWKFWIFLKFMKFWNFLKILNFFWKFWNLLKISEFSLIDDEVRVFRINIKLLSIPVAELKIRENDSYCRSIVLKTMDRSIVKQLEKEKNSNFNVEKFVVMLIYWGTITCIIT
jgi:hypothetical protein